MIPTCDTANLTDRLRAAGLRPTRQRVALARLMFGDGDRHLTAEQLHTMALNADVRVSLATVYNALHQFTDAGCCARSWWTVAVRTSIRTRRNIIIFSTKRQVGWRTSPPTR